MLKLYNTLTKQLEEIPKTDHLNLYTCGPTVYNYAHIGNLRTYISSDLLYRSLKYQGYNPKWVMNITDIEDKIIKAVIDKYGQDTSIEGLKDFTEEYLQAFIKDLKEVNVLVDEITFIKVTDVIPQIQDFIVKLIDKGYAYKEDDGVYFNIDKYQKDFGDYGGLVGAKFLEGKKVGARVKVDEYDKENLSDFALWKAHNPQTDAQIFWDNPVLGAGRPGWHIECSVINNIAFNGQPTDIHTGAVDLIFPHHTNEIAQSQALLGKGNFVKFWSHAEHLLVDGKRMAKSAGNFYTLADIKAKGFSPMDFRYSLLSANYRSQQNFTWEGLMGARQAMNNLSGVIPRSAADEESLNQAITNDLNIPEALGLIWKQKSGSTILEEVLGIKKVVADEAPSEIKNLVDLRQTAKQKKDFNKSDELRKQIEQLGYEVMDTPQGQKVKKKLSI
jgi:cysteinyl-tRNA synthetase